MKVPLELVFRNVPVSDGLEELIRQRAAALERVCDHISSCRVAVEKPLEYHKSGNPYRVRLDIRVPPKHEIAISREPGEGDQRELPAVIRNAFDAARRRLKKTVERQQGKVKAHPEQAVNGIVTVLEPQQDFGFLKSLEGRDVYFHRNSVVGGEFDRLEIGTGVRFTDEQGEKGLQATSVHIVDKP